MQLQHRPPPGQVPSAVLNRLRAVSHQRAFHTPQLRRAEPRQLFISTPHRVAMLTRRAIGAGDNWLEPLDVRGWRFLVHQGEDVIAAVETVITGDGEHRFGHIDEGPLVAGTADAIRWAEQHATSIAGTFEPILVLSPEFNLALLLFKQIDAPGVDYLMVISPFPRSLGRRELLDPRHVSAMLRAIAARKSSHLAQG